MSESNYPKGWEATRVQRVVDEFEGMTDDEVIAEDEAAFEERHGLTLKSVPDDLVPEIRKLIAERKTA